MNHGAAMHRTSLEVINGAPIEGRQQDEKIADTTEQASEQLFIAMERQFLGAARKWGVTFADARLFLMNSEMPRARG